MADLTDPERSFEFAQAAVEVGDVRGAIAALERVLLINPNLPNIALELGVLYQRVGNNVLASQYLEQALAAEQVPPPVRERAEALLGTAEAAISPHQLNGSLFVGLRAETNANAAPELARFLGEPVEPEEEQEDLSILGAATLDYSYAFGTQSGDALEVDALAFGQQYLESTELDTELLELTVGPRFYLGPVERPYLALRPFAETGYLRLGGEGYLFRYGGGFEAANTLSARLYVDGTLGVFGQDFSNTEEQTDAADRSGFQVEADAGVAYLLRPTTTLSGRLDYTRREANADFESFHEVGVSLAATERYDGPIDIVDVPWSATLSLDVSYADYDEPEPIIDPDNAREDIRLDVSLTNNIPLTPDVSLSTTGRYILNESTLPNFEYDNLALTVGVGWRF